MFRALTQFKLLATLPLWCLATFADAIDEGWDVTDPFLSDEDIDC